MSNATDSTPDASAKTLRAKLQSMEDINAGLQREAESLKAAIAKLRQDRNESEACAKFWRDAAEASSGMEARYKSTVLGLSHALADLKLAEVDLDADRDVAARAP
jgi:predicted component of type VI protein secretion system